VAIIPPAVIPRTHLAIDRRLCGEPLDLERTAEGTARVGLTTLPEMAADAAGLVHGGFVFGLADHAAMLAVNHPHVVLGSAAVRFLRPVAVGERLVALARREETSGRKSRVAVEVRRGGGGEAGQSGGAPQRSGEGEGAAELDAGEPVMSGEFVCITLDRPALGPAAAANAVDVAAADAAAADAADG
jgi:acyl-coenzyme A thioesterase PaaI-like protein